MLTWSSINLCDPLAFWNWSSYLEDLEGPAVGDWEYIGSSEIPKCIWKNVDWINPKLQ
jgi:hypothetical protein